MARAPCTVSSASAREGIHAAAPRSWVITNGSLEALKWVALVLMVGDHVNKYLLHEEIGSLYALGRMVMPIFGFVLMHNLCRPAAVAGGVHARVMRRLVIFGVLSTPAFAYLVGWWPLNILFTLFTATLVVFMWERGGATRRLLACAVFVFGGALVEFWWPAILCCLGAWAFLKRPTAWRLALLAMATGSLAVINGNFAAVIALLLIWGATRVDIPMPRLRWVFYAFYPAHLTALALLLASR